MQIRSNTFFIALHGHQLVSERACFEPSPCNCPTLCCPPSTPPLHSHPTSSGCIQTQAYGGAQYVRPSQVPSPLALAHPHLHTPSIHPARPVPLYTRAGQCYTSAPPPTTYSPTHARARSVHAGYPQTRAARARSQQGCRLRLSSRQPRVRIREPFQPVNTNCPRHRLSPTTNAHSLHPLTLLSPPHAHTHNAHRNPSPREDPLVQDLLDKAGAELGTSRSWRRSVSSADITGGQHTPQGGRTALSSSSSPAHGSPSSSSSSASSFSSRHAARPVRIGGRVALR